MTTLSNSFPKQSNSIAVIIPGDNPITLTFTQLSAQISSFQEKLARLGISHGAAVSIALPNSIEFIVRKPETASKTLAYTAADIVSSDWLATRVSMLVPVMPKTIF